jgi:hypothetical protein
MNYFQDLNREFEGELVNDIAKQLSRKHYLESKSNFVPCHDDKGGHHSSFEIEVSPGHLMIFHYCGGMGFMKYSKGGDWNEVPWMMGTKNVVAQRVAEYIDHIMQMAASYEKPEKKVFPENQELAEQVKPYSPPVPRPDVTPDEPRAYRFVYAVVGGMLLLAIGNMPWGFYQLLRWAVVAGGALLLVRSWKNEQIPWAIFGAVSIIFFFPPFGVSFEKEVWAVFDLLFGVCFLVAAATIRASRAVPRAKPEE